jgi:hypothetical protein
MNKLYHPCKQTCSGYQAGFEDALEKQSELLTYLKEEIEDIMEIMKGNDSDIPAPINWTHRGNLIEKCKDAINKK